MRITPCRPTGHRRARLHSSTVIAPGEEHDVLASIAVSLKETNQLLTKMSQRIDKVDGKVNEIEAKFSNNSPGLTPSRTRKKVVPTEVRVREIIVLECSSSNQYIECMSSKIVAPFHCWSCTIREIGVMYGVPVSTQVYSLNFVVVTNHVIPYSVKLGVYIICCVRKTTSLKDGVLAPGNKDIIVEPRRE